MDSSSSTRRMVAAVVDMVRGSGSYYSRGISTPPPASVPRRARRGSVERPINGRLYRIAWLVVALPALILAFTVGRPNPLPAPTLPPTFSAAGAAQVARTFAADFRERTPGTENAAAAVTSPGGILDLLSPFGLATHVEEFRATIPGLGPVDTAQRRRRRPGPLPADDRRHGPSRQRRSLLRSPGQQLGNSGARRARPRLHRLRGERSQAGAHDRLPVDGRRRVRRPRREVLRRARGRGEKRPCRRESRYNCHKRQARDRDSQVPARARPRPRS